MRNSRRCWRTRTGCDRIGGSSCSSSERILPDSSGSILPVKSCSGVWIFVRYPEDCSSGKRTEISHKGSSINDVTQFWTFFIPSPIVILFITEALVPWTHILTNLICKFVLLFATYVKTKHEKLMTGILKPDYKNNSFSTVCVKDFNRTLVKEPRWFWLIHFWPRLKQEVFWDSRGCSN